MGNDNRLMKFGQVLQDRDYPAKLITALEAKGLRLSTL